MRGCLSACIMQDSPFQVQARHLCPQHRRRGPRRGLRPKHRAHVIVQFCAMFILHTCLIAQKMIPSLFPSLALNNLPSTPTHTHLGIQQSAC